MSVLAAFLEHIGRLVHPAVAAGSLERSRHRTFLAARFSLVVMGLGAWVLAMATGHVARPWEAMAVVWLTVPFMAAVHVSRTGRLDQGEAACLAAWWGIAITTTLGGGTSLFGGCILLLIAPLEATFTGRAKLVNVALFAASVGVLLLGVAQASNLFPMVAGGAVAGDAMVAVPALLFVVVIAHASFGLQQQHQRLVAAGEARYRVLSEAIGDLVMRYDPAGGVLMASREAEPLFGVQPRDLLGRGFFDRVHVADRPAFIKLFADAVGTGANVSSRLRFRTGRTAADRASEPVFAWIEVRARRYDPVVEAALGVADQADGASASIVALVRDVSTQMERELAIESAKLEAERLSRWKDSFLANVSHELRTPLNAIIGFSEMLASRDLGPRDPDKQREYAGIIMSSGQHLLSVVNSLLDISKIEAGCFDIEPEPFALAPLIGACCDMMGLKAEQAGIAVHRAIGSKLGEIVGDKRACKQILINLMSNAVKFTPAGGAITVGARLEGDSVVIVVTDTGIGIAERDLTRLGDAFFQAKSGLDRPYEGTGLGLSVVRGLVGLHGGTITIESAPGEGTEVRVRLPADCRRVAKDRTVAAKIETISRYRTGLAPLRLAPSAKVSKVA